MNGDAFRRSLNFDELPDSSHDEIHVHVRFAILFIAKIQKNLPFDNSDAHRRNRILYRIMLIMPRPSQLSYRFCERHVSASDRRRTRAAVGLNDVAIDPDRSLAEAAQISDGTQASADKALDLMGAPANLATR